jgi:pimeloyl-ACP methyl ester carboxylesterase
MTDAARSAPRPVIKRVARLAVIAVVAYVAVLTLIYFRQRSMLFFPSHNSRATELKPWVDGERLIGWCREVTNASAIWLMLHGNGGQAAQRDYVLQRMSASDSLYVLEYPGYGSRAGTPSLESMNQAASEAYRLLRTRHPITPVCVLGESLGSGPACALAQEKIAPNKIVLVVPFDSLANVAAKKFWFLPVRFLLRDAWDNVEALKHYTGPVVIYGARYDEIIPSAHARALATQVAARFIEIDGGHNEWSESARVKIEP